MKKNLITLYIIISMIYTSCTNENTESANSSNIQTNEVVQSGTRDTDQSQIELNSSASNGSLPSTPLFNTPSGNVSTTTPIPGTWFIKNSFLQQYQHFCQLQASPEYPGGILCGPTSYMLGVHMIAHAKQVSYPATKNQVGMIHSRLHQADRFDNQGGMYISDLCWYENSYDSNIIQTAYKRTTDRTWMKEFIEYHLKTGYPVIVTVQVYGNKRSSWAVHDSDLYDQSGSTYYVSKNGNIGHFILLIGIKINADGTGTIWYKDPLAPTSATQSASYTRILDAMKFNGNPNYYDAVSLFE